MDMTKQGTTVKDITDKDITEPDATNTDMTEKGSMKIIPNCIQRNLMIRVVVQYRLGELLTLDSQEFLVKGVEGVVKAYSNTKFDKRVHTLLGALDG